MMYLKVGQTERPGAPSTQRRPREMASAQTASTRNLEEKTLCHSLLLWACFQKAL